MRAPRSRHHRAIVIAAIAALGLCAIAYATRSFARATLTIGCPSCFGFARASDHLYVQRGSSPGVSARVADAIAAARRRIVEFFGAQASDPTVFVCTSVGCYRRYGGGSRANSYLDRAVFVSPRGIDATIVAHELTHIELHHRIGATRFRFRGIPAWFDEGFAVYVSDDRRYLAPRGNSPDRCLVEPIDDLPTAEDDWIRLAGSNRMLYVSAACRVARWSDAHGGDGAFSTLIARLASGESFAVAFGSEP